MKTQSHNKYKKQTSKLTTSEIEKIVDQIIKNHKITINEIHSRENIVDRVSLKDKNGGTIYYLRKPNKKTKNTDDYSDKIISEAREKLGEDPLEKDDIKLPEIKEEKKYETRYKLGFNKDQTDKNKHFTKTTDDVINSEDIDHIVDDIEKKIDKKIHVNVDNEAKKLDEKIKQVTEPNQTKEKDELDKKAKKLAKKHKFFSKDKKEPVEKKQIPAEPVYDDLKFKVDNLEKTKSYDKDEEGLIDDKIRETKNKEIQAQESLNDLSNKNKSFFKRKKSIKEDSKESTQSTKIPNTPDYTDLKFKVDNVDKTKSNDKDEAKLLDKKIQEANFGDNKQDSDKEVENEAMRLAKEHIKDTQGASKQNLLLQKNKENNTSAFSQEKPTLKKESEHEHIFFDEEDTYQGWSPSISDNIKKKISEDLTAKPEIATEDFIAGSDIELPKDVLQIKSVKLEDLGFSENEWEELDFYSLHEPFAYVEILREKETLDKCYFLVEIELTEDEERNLEFISETMHTATIDTMELESEGGDEYLYKRLNNVIEEYNLKLSEESKNKIFYYICKSSLGLDKIDPLMKDPNIEDISCDGSGVPLFLYHRQYGSLKSNIRFNDEDELSSFVFKLAQKSGKHISIAEPMLDATMPDGSRIQMTLSDEITAKGSTFTIRKFRADPFSPPDLVEFNTMSSEMVAYMWLAVENGINTLFAGGTASGKTTALNALTLFVPRESKIVSIEETREINLPHPNWIPGVARSGFGEVVADRVVGEIDMYDLMKAALRQRPEYILVGEIRGREAYVLFQAMATGHATYSTVHADSAQSLIHRLEGKPINIPRVMLQSLDVISLHVITRVKNTRARRCKQIIEVIDIDPTTKEILTNEVFRWDPVEDRFVYSGKSYVLERIRAEKDLSREEMTDEIKNRTKIVEWMNDRNIREFREVANIIARYVESPIDVLNQIKKENKK